MKKLKFNLQLKFICVFLILGLFSSLVPGLYANYKSKSTIESTVGHTALGIASSVVGMIDTRQFNSLKTADDMKSEYYLELRSQLDEIRKSTGLKYLYTMRKTEDGKYIYVVDGLPMDSEDASLLEDEETEINESLAASFNGQEGFELNWTEEWGHLISAYVPIQDQSGKTIGMLGADFEANNVAEGLSNLRNSLFIIVIVIILIAILMSVYLSHILVKPINQLKNKAELIKSGDLTVQIDNTGTDEVGVLSQVFKEMVSGLTDITKEIQGSTQKVSESINFLSSSFTETAKASEEITQVISEVASGSVEQSKRVDEVSHVMDGVFNQVVNVVSNAKSVSDTANHAIKNTEEVSEIFKTSMQKVNKVNETVEGAASIIQEFGNKSKEISTFSETVSEIARQTNLLALNAAIEAARAGEQGRGFAVVADEIRKLADQTSRATVHINEIVNAMQAEVSTAITAVQDGATQAREGVSAVAQVDAYLEKLQISNKDAFLRVKGILDAINIIENDCRSSVEKIQEVADFSRSFSAGSQQSAASTEEQAASIQQIETHLDSIKQMTDRLDNAVSKFKIE